MNYNTSKAEVLVYAFKCEMCSFSTKRKHDFKRHVMQKHSEVDVSFPCALCDKTFQDEQSLKGILSHIYKPYLKDRHFSPDYNCAIKISKSFFIREKTGKN